eukprot:TRINITY_DN22598_c0_g1_i1.p1 TRINITY_DN22598_c0_g1~~TRINITY_DN22598_c0_g1_i1.p1  ORF type:complete len:530 (+),score=105.12 TRINITY_DN22598_c0_g1_i1:49-1638(+)
MPTPKKPGALQEPSFERLQVHLISLKEQQEQALKCLVSVLDGLSTPNSAGEMVSTAAAAAAEAAPKVSGSSSRTSSNQSSSTTASMNMDVVAQELDEALEREEHPDEAPESAENKEQEGDWKHVEVENQVAEKVTHKLSSCAAHIVMDKRFDYLVGVVILLNTITIGVDTQQSIQGEELPSLVDFAFLGFYTVEIGLRLCGLGLRNFKSAWFVFDFGLVSLSYIMDILVPTFLWLAGVHNDLSLVEKLLLFRTFRLLRLIRSVRTIPMFRTAWRLTHGLLTSGNAILSMLSLLVLFLYIFACAGVELITKDTELASHPDTAHIVAYHFGSLHRILLTLFGFVCADSVASIYTPLIIVKPYLAIYFLLLLVIISVTLMNLVTAVLVEGALDQASADKELERHEQLEKVKSVRPKLMKIFKDLDIDGDGQVTPDEINMVPLGTIPRQFFPEQVGSMMEVFELLDVGEDGELSQEEFVEGLLDLLCCDVPIHAIQILRLQRLNKDKITDLDAKLNTLLASYPGPDPEHACLV